MLIFKLDWVSLRVGKLTASPPATQPGVGVVAGPMRGQLNQARQCISLSTTGLFSCSQLIPRVDQGKIDQKIDTLIRFESIGEKLSAIVPKTSGHL